MAGTTRQGLTRREAAGLLMGLLGFAAVSPARAESNSTEDSRGAGAYVSKIAAEVMGLANGGRSGDALRSKFVAILNKYINIRGIASFALGQYQSKLAGADKEQFYSLFSNYVASLFVAYVADFRGSDLKIISITSQGNFTTITSAIVSKGMGREQVKWRLASTGGSYRISDINVKGVWLSIATKKRFGDVLKRSGGDFGPLFAELKKADTW
jgi:phospholipid transport system substrate-binding protein